MNQEHNLIWNGESWEPDNLIPIGWIYKYIDPRRLITHKVNMNKVRRYAIAMMKGDKFPPVHVFLKKDGRLRVNNGANRTIAAVLAGKKLFIKTKETFIERYL